MADVDLDGPHVAPRSMPSEKELHLASTKVSAWLAMRLSRWYLPARVPGTIVNQIAVPDVSLMPRAGAPSAVRAMSIAVTSFPTVRPSPTLRSCWTGWSRNWRLRDDVFGLEFPSLDDHEAYRAIWQAQAASEVSPVGSALVA